MNKQIYLITLLLTCRICSAQNLVPNGDFEGYSGCPDNTSQFDSTLFWFNPTAATPDYFNQCATLNVGVPYNDFGYQPAHSGGGYAGLYQIALTNWHEYIEVPLITPLIAGNCYQFEMYINGANDVEWMTYEIGVYFSDSSYYLGTYEELPLTPQISNATGNYPDTILWMPISGNYTASGGESYMIIGNFKPDTSTTTILFNINGWHHGAYVHIDDVCLTPCGSTCTTGINDPTQTESINIFPNPVADELKIKVANTELSEIILYDISSRNLLQQKFKNTVSINTESLAKGIYLYEVRCGSSLCKKGKLVKD